ncbi:MAG: hypothetical protein QE263_05705 [Vampirovibrionales bacterium]|nr:hypothetical protein [Vampirovibrionales bacterium]
MNASFSARLQPNANVFGANVFGSDEFSPMSTRPIVGMSAILDEVVWQDLSLMEMSTRCHPRGNVALEPLILGWVTLTPCGACL